MNLKSGEKSLKKPVETMMNPIKPVKVFTKFFSASLFWYIVQIYIIFKYNEYCFLIFYHENNTTLELVTNSAFKAMIIPSLFINFFYYLFYHFEFSWAEKYKVNNLPWPWQKNPKEWPAIFRDILSVYLSNQFIFFTPMLYVFTYFYPPLIDKNKIPNAATFLVHLYISEWVEDFLTYWTHRFLHLPFIYKKIHKKHHDQKNVFNIVAFYEHWVEFAFFNIVPMLAGMVVLHGHVHVITLNAFIIVRMFAAHANHSGYYFPWMNFLIFPYSYNSPAHNYHHLKNNGNYGSYLWIWDWMFKTNKEYLEEMGWNETDSLKSTDLK